MFVIIDEVLDSLPPSVMAAAVDNREGDAVHNQECWAVWYNSWRSVSGKAVRDPESRAPSSRAVPKLQLPLDMHLTYS